AGAAAAAPAGPAAAAAAGATAAASAGAAAPAGATAAAPAPARRGVDARVGLVRPLELHLIAVHRVGVADADVADLPVGVVVPGEYVDPHGRIGHRLDHLVGRDLGRALKE